MKTFIRTYIVSIHLVLAGVLWKSDFIERVGRKLGHTMSTSDIKGRFHHLTVHYHERSIGSVPEGAVIFLGDSLTHSLCVTAAAPHAVNYGIGKDTTEGLLQRLHKYVPAIERAHCVVIAIGGNDASLRTVDQAIGNYETILSQFPATCRVIVSSVLPLDDRVQKVSENRRLWAIEFNAELEKLVAKFPQVGFLDNSSMFDQDNDGRLDGKLHVGDGINLSTEGNLRWAATLKAEIEKSVP